MTQALGATGANNWNHGKTYHTKAPERWAWAANSCYAPKGSPFRSSKYERLLPGGCSFVRKWQ